MIVSLSRVLVSILLTLGAVFCAAANPDASQEYLVHVWQTDDGLPQNWVSSITQTADGYLWIGTRYGGLARFDGIRFVHFTPQNTPGLGDVQVERLSVASDGTLWIAMTNQAVTRMRHGRFDLLRAPRTEPELRLASALSSEPHQTFFTTESGEIAVLDPAKGKGGWKILKPTPAARAFTYNVYPPDTFHRDREGNLWYIDQNQQLARFTVEGNREIPPALRVPGARINALEIGPQGSLWIATEKQIVSWNGRTIEDHTPADNGPLGDVRDMAFSADGGLWVLQPDRLRKLVNRAWAATADADLLKASISSRHYKLYGDSHGGAWVASYGHGLLHARADGSTRQLAEAQGLPSELVTCWFEDNEANIWIGTAGGGVARIRERVFRTLGPADGLPEKVVRSVAVDAHGAIWAGTMSGQLTRWSGGKAEVLPLPPVEATPLGGIAVWPSRTGIVWIGSLYHGLMRLENGRITRPSRAGDIRFIRIFFEDRKNRLWIGEMGGLRRYAAGSEKFFGTDEGFQTGVAVGAMAEDPSGALWIGTGPGDLWRCENDQFTRFRPPLEWPPARMVSLQADPDGVVWIGTLGNGLLRFAHGQFTRFQRAHGLPDDNVTQLLDDGHGDLWGGTYAGIFHVKKSALNDFASGRTANVVCVSYGRRDGLPALECTAGFNPACWRADDGRLWFSTVNGLVSVDPTTVSPNRRPPDVIIEELHIDGRLHSLADDGAGRSPRAALQIPAGRHFLQFRFTGLSFSAPDKVRFRWRLSDIDRDWQESGTQRIIGVGPLPPGSYRLDVQACNSDGVWNEKPATLAFTVLPYFWETWWFKVTLLVSSFAGLTAIVLLQIRRRYQRSMERLKRQHEIERERTRIARDLHDDLGTSLTQISMLSALANREQTSAPESKDLVRQVHGRAREMVTALDEIVWAVNPKNDSWAELANYLGSFAEEFFRPTGIRCRLEIPEQMPAQPLSAELRHHIFLAFKEALNNAARHSNATLIWVRIETRATDVLISVEDNGRGFSPEPDPQRSRGNGLVNMQRRLEQVGGSCEVRAATGRGTTVSFRVPLPN